jgi:hypothetical protein
MMMMMMMMMTKKKNKTREINTRDASAKGVERTDDI